MAINIYLSHYWDLININRHHYILQIYQINKNFYWLIFTSNFSTYFFLTALILSPHYHRNHINNKYRTHNTAVKSVQLLILICKQPHHNTSTAQYDHIIYSWYWYHNWIDHCCHTDCPCKTGHTISQQISQDQIRFSVFYWPYTNENIWNDHNKNFNKFFTGIFFQ